jgi:post-segregation antitoxin (ccd killing protein)
MSSRTTSRGNVSPFPEHYEQTHVDGKEHPADVVINNLPAIVRFKRRLSKLSEKLRQSVRDPKAFVAYADTRGLYQSTRENLFFDAGFEHGLLAARQDCAAERILNHPAAHRLLAEINQLTLTTELPRNRVVMLLLEAAWAQVFGIAIPATASLTVSPELAAIRDALWPEGNMEAVWSPDTIDQIARIARPHGQNGGTKGGHHG